MKKLLITLSIVATAILGVAATADAGHTRYICGYDACGRPIYAYRSTPSYSYHHGSSRGYSHRSSHSYSHGRSYYTPRHSYSYSRSYHRPSYSRSYRGYSYCR